MIEELINRYPCLSVCRQDILAAQQIITDCYEKGSKLLLCGNGGSAADCEHISGELMKGFLKKRSVSDEERERLRMNNPELEDDVIDCLQGGLSAIPLASLSSVFTAVSNDTDSFMVYAQSVYALGKKGDVLIAISTSGNSRNICLAAQTAKALGMKIIALTGENGGKIRDISDVSICVPERETYKIQELHLPVYHYICAAVEEKFFG